MEERKKGGGYGGKVRGGGAGGGCILFLMVIKTILLKCDFLKVLIKKSLIHEKKNAIHTQCYFIMLDRFEGKT